MTDLALVVALAGSLFVGVAVGWLAASGRSAARLRAAEVEAARWRASAEVRGELGGTAGEERQADRFRALAADALAQSSEQFLALAHQSLAARHQEQSGDLAQREQAVRALVDPLARTLDAVRAELRTAEQARAQGDAALGEQVRQMREEAGRLREETARLVTSLRSSQVRGRWGEVQLRRVVEAAGMLPHVDFVEQDQVRTDDGLLRPDMVVHLAGGKRVVVDAKVAFLGFLEAVEATDAAERQRRTAAHARHVRAHVDQLAAKRYWDQFAPAPEFVVMFVPAEAFLHAALDVDPGIVERAFEQNVVIATPMTLLALLRTVAYAWRQDALADNAQAVLDLGKELHGRIATLGGHLSKVGRAIDGAATAYNQSIASLESRVLVSARRFADLRVVDTDLPTPQPVERRLSVVTAPELVAWEEARVVGLDGGTVPGPGDERHRSAALGALDDAVLGEPGGIAAPDEHGTRGGAPA
ncbi:DNA recombination protein RmuC [Cellulomonas sp. C5510]|uniref:DNA recombination protein RmuC n=1 Tax=Cellulomonas sp. C5510 TaxID=2871170 RepID=UPI001C938FFE|nr:DNA recombination protein RmuC [Cellulomonas sp. C5510]QZN86382.1 DNA recombination protein RmuC [Cellulomonas sp. C5510]